MRLFTAFKLFCLLVPAMLWLTSCDKPAPLSSDGHPEYVVNAYLVAGEKLPPVTLHTTGVAGEQYNWQQHSVRDARVMIRLLGEDGSVRTEYEYHYASDGHYLPGRYAIVRPEMQYQLLIRLADGDSVEAKTTVPGRFRVVNCPDRRYTYRQDTQLQLVTTPSDYPGRPAYYLFTADAHHRFSQNLTPFYKDLIEEKGLMIESYYKNSSDITGAGLYSEDERGNRTLNVPWSLFAFYGKNTVSVSAIDDNLYQAWPVIAPGLLTEGLSLSPGEMRQVPSHINGGIGIFGSLSRITRTVWIDPPAAATSILSP